MSVRSSFVVPVKDGHGGGDLRGALSDSDEAVGWRLVWPQVMQGGQGGAHNECGEVQPTSTEQRAARSGERVMGR